MLLQYLKAICKYCGYTLSALHFYTRMAMLQASLHVHVNATEPLVKLCIQSLVDTYMYYYAVPKYHAVLVL